MATAYIKKTVREVTTGKRGVVVACAFSFVAVAAAAQPLPATSAAEADMPVAPSEVVPQPSESPPPPAPPAEVLTPPPEIAPPAPIPSDGSAIRTRFGAPDFVRREMQNELWRYDGKNCSVFFFLQHQGAMLELRYTETLPRGMDMAADPVCVASLEQRIAKMPGDVTEPAAVPP